MKLLKDNWQLLAVIAVLVVAIVVVAIKHTKVVPIKDAAGNSTGESKLEIDYKKAA